MRKAADTAGVAIGNRQGTAVRILDKVQQAVRIVAVLALHAVNLRYAAQLARSVIGKGNLLRSRACRMRQGNRAEAAVCIVKGRQAARAVRHIGNSQPGGSNSQRAAVGIAHAAQQLQGLAGIAAVPIHNRQSEAVFGVHLGGNDRRGIVRIQRQRHAQVGQIVILAVFLREGMLRAVCVGINIVENADVVGVRAGFAVQRLVKRGAPAIAQTEIILIHIAGIVEVLYRGRQAQAAGGKIRQGENHIAVRQADICRARAPDIQRIIGQILLQTRQAGIFQHKVGLAAAAGGFHHHRVGPAPLGFNLHAVVGFAAVPAASQRRNVQENIARVRSALWNCSTSFQKLSRFRTRGISNFLFNPIGRDFTGININIFRRLRILGYGHFGAGNKCRSIQRRQLTNAQQRQPITVSRMLHVHSAAAAIVTILIGTMAVHISAFDIAVIPAGINGRVQYDRKLGALAEIRIRFAAQQPAFAIAGKRGVRFAQLIFTVQHEGHGQDKAADALRVQRMQIAVAMQGQAEFRRIQAERHRLYLRKRMVDDFILEAFRLGSANQIDAGQDARIAHAAVQLQGTLTQGFNGGLRHCSGILGYRRDRLGIFQAVGQRIAVRILHSDKRMGVRSLALHMHARICAVQSGSLRVEAAVNLRPRTVLAALMNGHGVGYSLKMLGIELKYLAVLRALFRQLARKKPRGGIRFHRRIHIVHFCYSFLYPLVKVFLESTRGVSTELSEDNHFSYEK